MIIMKKQAIETNFFFLIFKRFAQRKQLNVEKMFVRNCNKLSSQPSGTPRSNTPLLDKRGIAGTSEVHPQCPRPLATTAVDIKATTFPARLPSPRWGAGPETFGQSSLFFPYLRQQTVTVSRWPNDLPDTHSADLPDTHSAKSWPHRDRVFVDPLVY